MLHRKMALIFQVHFGPLLHTYLHIRKIRTCLILTVSLCIGKASWIKYIGKYFVRPGYVDFFRAKYLQLSLLQHLTAVTMETGEGAGIRGHQHASLRMETQICRERPSPWSQRNLILLPTVVCSGVLSPQFTVCVPSSARTVPLTDSALPSLSPPLFDPSPPVLWLLCVLPGLSSPAATDFWALTELQPCAMWHAEMKMSCFSLCVPILIFSTTCVVSALKVHCFI